MADEPSRPNWYGHAMALSAAIMAFSPVVPTVREWIRPNLISLEDANRRVQEEVEAMSRYSFTPALLETVVFDRDGERYSLKVFADEAMIQQRKYKDGHEAYRFVPSLKMDRHSAQASLLSLPVVHAEEATQPNVCERYGHAGQPTVETKAEDRCRVRVHLTWWDGCWAEYVYDPCQRISSPIQFGRCAH